MKRIRLSIYAGILPLLVLFLTACSIINPPTPTPTATFTPTPTSTFTPTPSSTPTFTPTPSITVKHSKGVLTITRVYTWDRYPLDCKPDAAQFDANRCFVQAYPNFTILFVEYTGPNIGMDKTIYVTQDNGTDHVNVELAGFGGDTIFFAFSVSKSTKHFTLYVPDNPPVELTLGPAPVKAEPTNTQASAGTKTEESPKTDVAVTQTQPAPTQVPPTQ